MKATILCYHQVGLVSAEGRRLNIEPRRLDSHVRFYARRGHVFVRVQDFLSSVAAGAICFTFDDAYLSAVSHACEVLERHGKRGTFYAVSGRAGKSSDWDGELARPLATFESLREAQSRGHEIGNHTANHVRLAGNSLEGQVAEILGAREHLRAEGIDTSTICYPYGSYDGVTIQAAREAGYGVGLSLVKGLVGDHSDRLVLPRIVVAFSDTLPMLIYKTVVRARMRRV